jgi:hypothetical protein
MAWGERESKIEEKIWRLAEKRGWWQTKFVSPGLNGVPDRIFLRIKDGVFRCVFIEVKKPGEEPSRQQNKRREELIAAGAECYWVDALEQASVILK